MSTFSVNLTRGNGASPWGFRLQGGADFRSPLVLQRVNPRSIAEQSGLNVGDVILEINGSSTTPMRHQEAQQSIINSGNRITLKISRGANPLPTAAAPPPAADPDVAAVTLKTAKLAVDSTASQPRAPSPSFQEFGKQAVESARYKEQVNDTPQYRPYTNPNLQSQSFKSLQSTIDSGRDPGSYFQQAPWQSATVNKVESEPRKYAPSKTWAAVHAEGRGGGDKGGVPPAPQAGPYKPPPADRYRDVGSKDQYKPPSYNNPKPAGGPKPFTPPAPSPQAAGDNLATKGTSAFNQSANSDKIPICAKCDCDIRGPFVLALNKSWCPNHFTCSKCNSELVNMGFVELNGSIYCENDYQNFFAPKCAKCRQAIIGDTVNALEKTWHPACFACEECGEAISSGAFHVEEGRPYCMKDWTRLFSTKCIGCSYPVEPGDKWIEALDANWHSECFVCGVCRMQLEGKPFFPRDGKPFCRDHAIA